jgi:hypothetical protein
MLAVHTPGEQQGLLQVGRFAVHGRTRRLMRFGLISLIVLGAMWIVVVHLLSMFPKTMLTEERPGNDFVRYGFAVQQARIGYGTVVRLWATDPKGTYEDIRLNTPRLRLKQIKQHTWLAKNQALLLAMSMEVDLGSYTQSDERWLLYNFRSGDLKTCSSWQRTPCADLQASASDEQ